MTYCRSLLHLSPVALNARDKSQFRRELEEAPPRVGLFSVIGMVRWPKAVLIGWQRKSDQFIDAIAKAGKCLACAKDGAICYLLSIGCFLITAGQLHWNFRDAVEDVGKTAAELAQYAVFRTRRLLDISHADSGNASSEDENEELFHK